MGLDIDFHFEGGKFLVVGASSGIGRQITEDVVKAGGIVLAVARNTERLSSVRETAPDRIYTESVDVRDADALEQAVNHFVARNGKIDGSVYTAGISRVTPLKCYSREEAAEIMDINYWGFVRLMGILNRRKYSADGCSHVVISSVAGYTGEAGNFAYSASKSAVMNSVRTFAKEAYKRGTRINSISPGFVNTSLSEGFFETRGLTERTREKHLLGFGESADISGMARFLLSDCSRWITGQDFVVDGGYLISD